MNSREALKAAYPQSDMIVKAYLGDLTEDEMFVRPVDGINHIAWQMGHLIASQKMMVDQVKPGSMPDLPEGFAEQHDKETSASDDRSAFLSKNDYINLYDQVHNATLAALEATTDEELDAAAPESMQRIAPTVGAIFSMQPVHWMMHAGQWAVTRRSVGRPPLF